MYVSKELALILKDRGFSKSFSSNSYYTTILSEEVVDWIFSEVSTRNYAKQGNVKWLQFWYTTLLEHKFSLMHEFIGRLEEWFESNGYYINVANHFKKNGVDINDRVFSISISHKKYHNESDYNAHRVFQLDIETKQQAKHEAVMKCFELLNSDKDDAQ